jgi:tetratricopeptide (TPR) repeat protein
MTLVSSRSDHVTLLGLGTQLYRQGDLTSARVALRYAARSKDPQIAAAAELTLGRISAQRGWPREARKHWRRAARGGPAIAILAAAHLLTLEGDHDFGRTAASLLQPEPEEVESKETDSLPQRMRAGNINVAMYRTGLPLQPAVETLRSAYRAERAGKHQRALKLYRQAADDPDSYLAATAAETLGLYLQERGDFAAAEVAFRRAMASDSTEEAASGALHLGTILIDQLEFPRALAPLQFAMDSGHPKHAPAAASMLATVLALLGDRGGARKAARYAVKHGSDDDALLARAVLRRLEDAD